MAVTWTTRAGEPVGVGDLVALSVLRYSDDAVGRIVTQTGEGGIQCVLIRTARAGPGTFVTVEEDQLLVRVFR